MVHGKEKPSNNVFYLKGLFCSPDRVKCPNHFIFVLFSKFHMNWKRVDSRFGIKVQAVAKVFQKDPYGWDVDLACVY